MKVKMIDAEEAALGFLRKVVGTMPTTGHKFLGGLMVASSLGRIEGFLGSMADAEGCIDTDVVRRMVSEGFASSGDKVTFTIGDDSVRWLVKPVNVSVSKSDFDEMLAGLEARYQ